MAEQAYLICAQTFEAPRKLYSAGSTRMRDSGAPSKPPRVNSRRLFKQLFTMFLRDYPNDHIDALSAARTAQTTANALSQVKAGHRKLCYKLLITQRSFETRQSPRRLHYAAFGGCPSATRGVPTTASFEGEPSRSLPKVSIRLAEQVYLLYVQIFEGGS